MSEPTGPENDILEASLDRLRGGLLAEADALLSDHVGSGGAGVLERLEWIKMAAVMGDHAAALSRLRAAKDCEPGVDWSELEIELLIRSRSFSAAAALIETLRRKQPASQVLDLQEGKIGALARIAANAAGRDRGQSTDAAYCINLDDRPQKWRRCEVEAAQANLSLVRVSGLKGSCIPRRLMPRLGKSVDPDARGTLGCFISHVQAWERIVDSGAEIALVLEDDFRPCVGFPRDFAAFGLPDGFDVCWVSERMAISDTGELRFVKVEDVASAKTAHTAANQVYHWAVGAEAYLVSRKGAQKLVEFVAEDGLFGDVDARLLAYSLSAEARARLSIHSSARYLVDAHWKIIKARKPLRAFAASIGLIGLADTGSDRKQQNAVGR